MPRVLVIDPDGGALAALQAALGRAGLQDVSGVTSGSFALTTLERTRPDLIVSRVSVPDIDGYELCSIVRKDPSMQGVLFVLLASPGDETPEVMLEEKPDQTLAGDLPLTTIVSEVAGLLGTRAPTPAHRVPPAAPADHGLRGSLAVMDLPDIAQAIALGGKTGELLVTLPSGRGVVVFDQGRVVHVVFDQGRVVHAEFFGLIGETAFAALLVAAHGALRDDAHGNFVFNPLENGAASEAKTIHRDLKQLLLSAVADIDEGREDTPAGREDTPAGRTDAAPLS
jgi:CheY-like chemotaxis protein